MWTWGLGYDGKSIEMDGIGETEEAGREEEESCDEGEGERERTLAPLGPSRTAHTFEPHTEQCAHRHECRSLRRWTRRQSHRRAKISCGYRR